MNKKVITLCAGMLLAGGTFFSVNAQTAADGLYEVAGKGTYHFVKLENQSSANVSWAGSWNMAVKDGKLKVANDGNVPSEDNLWKVTEEKVNGKRDGFSLVNRNGVKLAFDKDGNFKEGGEINRFYIEDENEGHSLYAWVGNGIGGTETKEKWELVQQGGNTLKLVNYNSANPGSDTECAVYYVTPSYMDAYALNVVLGNGFGLQICYQPLNAAGTAVDEDKDPVEYASLQGNPFTGKLVAESGKNGVTLKNGNGKNIILTSEKWGNLGSNETVTGYKFAAVTDKELDNMKDSDIKATEFNIAQPIGYEAPLEVSMTIDGTKYELIVVEVKGEYLLTVALGKSPSYDFKKVPQPISDDSNLADYTFEYPERANQNTYVKFGLSNAIDNDIFIGKVWNIYKNDQIASPLYDGAFASNVDYVPVSQVSAAYPEGQWLWDDKAEVFTNRETGVTISWADFNGLRKTDKADTYVSDWYNNDGEYVPNTYKIVAAGDPSGKEPVTLGYLNGYSDDKLKQKAFFIGAPVEATGDIVYLSKGAKGVLKFTKDKSEAVEFRLTAESQDYKHKDAQVHTTYTAWKDNKVGGKKVQNTDVVSLLQYTITDAVSEAILAYDDVNERFYLADKEVAQKEGLNQFKVVFKNKSANTYNIVLGHDDFVTSQDNDDWHKVNFVVENNEPEKAGYVANASKLYGAFNVSELVAARSLYDFVQNDQFIITDASAQQYRGDFSESKLDTIKVFRNADNNYVMYEQGALLSDGKDAIAGFLGIENFKDENFAGKNAALLADTAIHANTYRPQYMLAVGAKIVPAGKWCEIHQSSDCPHAKATKGYVEGRYLVNLVDSANKAKEALVKPADNKFMYQNYESVEHPYYRLGFVQAKHIGDSLIIAATKDTIDLKNGYGDNVCTFAFKYADANRESFTIETAYNYIEDKYNDVIGTNRGYVKYHNGKLVVTPKASEAEVFNLAELTGIAPTANEEIATSEVVVAATDGAVVVKGAAGKAVVVTNILGQTLANEVVSSDNATIAVPAGIAVVAVEGEAAVKVVVK